MTIDALLFWIFAALACGGALGVVLASRIVRMAFWLVVSLGSVAALFFLLNAEFLGAAQLLIYVGGTIVILVFGVMLTAGGAAPRLKATPGESLLCIAVAASLFGLCLFTVGSVDWVEVARRQGSISHENRPTAGTVGHGTHALGSALVGFRPAVVTTNKDGQPVKQVVLQTGYLLPFEIISVHLLVVLLGAAYLARPKQRREAGAIAASSGGPA